MGRINPNPRLGFRARVRARGRVRVRVRVRARGRVRVRVNSSHCRPKRAGSFIPWLKVALYSQGSFSSDDDNTEENDARK